MIRVTKSSLLSPVPEAPWEARSRRDVPQEISGEEIFREAFGLALAHRRNADHCRPVEGFLGATGPGRGRRATRAPRPGGASGNATPGIPLREVPRERPRRCPPILQE